MQQSLAKSQVSRAVAELGAIKTAYETCMNDGKTAAKACALGWTASNIITQTTPGVEADGTNTAALSETGTIVGTFSGNAAVALQGTTPKTVTWTRTADGAWTCATTAPKKYEAAGCPGV